MGFFSSLIKAVGAASKQEAKPKAAPTCKLRPWRVPAVKMTHTLVGDTERDVYIYDGRPLSSVRKGSAFELEVFRGDATMRSIYTGREDGTDSYRVCMLYDGEPVGFVSMSLEEVRKAADSGIALRARAKCHGMVEGYKGVKDIRVTIPRKLFAEDVIADMRAMEAGAPADHGVYGYNEYDEDDFRGLAARNAWEIPSARVELIPTPKGSSAKPHVGVYMEDGTLVSEVAAKDCCYKDLVEIADGYSHYYVIARRWAKDDGSAAYHIRILYW